MQEADNKSSVRPEGNYFQHTPKRIMATRSTNDTPTKDIVYNTSLHAWTSIDARNLDEKE